jgi:hypothetical protein
MIHHLALQQPSGRALLLLTHECILVWPFLLHLLASTQQSSTARSCTQRTAAPLAWCKHHWHTWARRPCLPTTVDVHLTSRERVSSRTKKLRTPLGIAHCACPFIFERRATERPFRARSRPRLQRQRQWSAQVLVRTSLCVPFFGRSRLPLVWPQQRWVNDIHSRPIAHGHITCTAASLSL